MIETRLLTYFLAVAREQNLTRAAESLYITQPTLSKQMMLLEKELGRTLFIRGKRRITLTQDGEFLRERAQEMIDLMSKTEEVFHSDQTNIAGEISIGCGETHAMEYITGIFEEIHREYPLIRFHLFSGDASTVSERLDKGLVDAGLMLSPVRQERYQYLDLNVSDDFGLLMRRDDPLAQKPEIGLQELKNLPLIVPMQLGGGEHDIDHTFKKLVDRHTVATYSLIFNATFLVEKKIGYAVCLSDLIDENNAKNLVFRPFSPRLPVEAFLVTRKYQTFSPAMRLFLDRIEAKLLNPQID